MIRDTGTATGKLVVVGISPDRMDVRLWGDRQPLCLTIAPDEIHQVSAKGTELQSRASFNYSYSNSEEAWLPTK
jgi:hypothetical protein